MDAKAAGSAQSQLASLLLSTSCGLTQHCRPCRPFSGAVIEESGSSCAVACSLCTMHGIPASLLTGSFPERYVAS